MLYVFAVIQQAACKKNKNLCNNLRFTKPNSNPFVSQKLCHFLDSVIRGD